jgi:hypothetical protein
MENPVIRDVGFANGPMRYSNPANGFGKGPVAKDKAPLPQKQGF